MLHHAQHYIVLENTPPYIMRLRGAMVARLTPDQKVACSNHVGVMFEIISVNISYMMAGV